MKKDKRPIEGKAILTLEEFCEYVSIGKTKGREILNDPRCSFSFFIGNRTYANKTKLDERIKICDTLL